MNLADWIDAEEADSRRVAREESMMSDLAPTVAGIMNGELKIADELDAERAASILQALIVEMERDTTAESLRKKIAEKLMDELIDQENDDARARHESMFGQYVDDVPVLLRRQAC